MKKINMLLGLVVLSIGALSAQTLQMGADDSTKKHFPLIEALLSEAGLTPVLVVQPGGRSIENANNGTLDGEIWRIASIQTKYSDLIPVPTPLTVTTFSAYCKTGGITISSPADLDGKKVVIVRGTKASEGFIATTKAEVIYATNVDNLIQILEAGRADVAFHGDSILTFLGDNPNITKQNPPLLSVSIHIWLNKKNSHLIPAIDDVIAAWGAEKLNAFIADL